MMQKDTTDISSVSGKTKEGLAKVKCCWDCKDSRARVTSCLERKLIQMLK